MAISSFTKAPQEIGQVSDMTSDINRGFGLYRQGQKEARAQQDKNEAEYLKLAKVDPVYTESEGLQKLQAKWIDEYINNIADIYHKSPNRKLSLQDEMKVQNLHTALLGGQMRIKNAQKDADDVRKIIESDPYGDKWDVDHAKEWLGKYESGIKNSKGEDVLRFDKNEALKPALEKNPEKWLEKNVTNGEKKTFNTYENGKHVVKEVMVYNGDDPETAKKSALNLLNNGKWEATMMKQFHDLPEAEQNKYYEKYGSDAKSILAQFQIDKYPKYFTQKEVSTKPFKEPKAKSGHGSTVETYRSDTGEPLATRSMRISSKQVSPVKVGDVSINNEQDYNTLLRKGKRTPDENQAIIDYDQSKKHPKMVDVETPIWARHSVKSGLSINVPAKEQIDLSTGKAPKDVKGNRIYRNVVLEKQPWNEKENRFATVDEAGTEDNPNEGITGRWVLVSKDADGKTISGKFATEADLKEIKNQYTGSEKKQFDPTPIIEDMKKSQAKHKSQPKNDPLGIL